MGSGLILGGIGKGIADAGAAYAGGMMKGAEFEMQNQRDEDREHRLEMRKTKELEALKQRVISESAQVEQRAADMPITRGAAEASSKLASISPDASQVQSPAELAQYMREHPEYKAGLEKAGLISDKMNPELRAANDRSKAALELGAHSSVIEAFDKQRSAVLSQIKEERTARHQEAMEEQGATRADAAMKMADAAERRAAGGGKGSGEKPVTGVDLERASKAAERSLALKLGVTLKDVPETVARLKKQGKMDNDTQEYLTEYEAALKEWQGYRKRKPKADDANTVDNVTPPANRPPLGSFVRP